MADDDFKFPAIQKLELRPLNDTKPVKLNWTCREYIGCEAYFEGDVEKKPLLTRDAIKVGDRLIAWGMVVVVTELNPPSAETTSGNTLAILDFNKDDRHCWVVSGMVNRKALKQLTKTMIRK